MAGGLEDKWEAVVYGSCLGGLRTRWRTVSIEVYPSLIGVGRPIYTSHLLLLKIVRTCSHLCPRPRLAHHPCAAQCVFA